MATWLQPMETPWEQLPVQLLQNAKIDDLAALAAVFLASVVYVTKGTLWQRPDRYRYKLFERPQQQPGALAAEKQSRDLAELLNQGEADIAILWASQSGTAERLAGRLAKELTRQCGAKVALLDVSDIEPASCAKIANGKLAIFLASTFGEGDPSDNMHEFWEWLHQDSSISLENLRYLAFGLGNSNYKHYNEVIRVLDDRLQHRGAKPLMTTATADDAAGDTEEHFLEWKTKVLELFQTTLGYQQREYRYEPSLHIVEDSSLEPIDLHCGVPQDQALRKASTTQSKTYALPITQSRELFQDSTDRNCIHIELDLSQMPELKYKTGDHLAVWPVNPTEEVNRLLRVLGLESKRATPSHVRSVDGTAVKVPSPTTPEALFQHYLEICAPVSREHIGLLASFAPTQPARDLLLAISRDKNAYANYADNRYINLGRLMEAACDIQQVWDQLPLSFVIEMLPAMRPRHYSISSSSVVHARQAAITAVVADTNSSIPEKRIPGLATNYLLYAKAGLHPRGLEYTLPLAQRPLERGHIHASVRKSTFKLPTMASSPIVMVGAGTGIAPFRAFVQERARLKTMGRPVGATNLFFGCRNPDQDYIYKDEFEKLSNELGDTFSMTTAFSRPNNGARKRYVQDAITDQAAAICELLIDSNAYFYICGSAAMARDVANAVGQVVMSRQGWDETRMKEFADQQKKTKRWLQDVWG